MARRMGRESLRKSSPAGKRKRDKYFQKRRQKSRVKGFLKGVKGAVKKALYRDHFMGAAT